MKKVVLFGAGKIAEVVHHLMTREAGVAVAGFTCDPEFVQSDEIRGLPLVPFDEVVRAFPPDDFDMFVATGYQQMNSLREQRLAQAKEKGYGIATFVHPRSGMSTDVEPGENCFIMNDVLIQPKVKLGSNVFVWSGALIGHHATVGDNCWVTSNASIAGVVTAGRNCFFAVNSTVANNVTLGERCFLGANSLVTKDLADGAVVIAGSTEVQRLNSDQFVRMSSFT